MAVPSGHWEWYALFQSTLSMRRATNRRARSRKDIDISIHALHEESDLNAEGKLVPGYISIHALHEESDLARLARLPHQTGFQSTLSMRRATQGV